VYQPTQRGHYPVLVQIYGGAWQRGEPGSNADFATLLASHGWVVFAIDYRHAPSVHWPVLMDDVDSSLVWIRAHAAEYDGDTARVVLMGRSAGAHLAKLAAYRRPVLHVRGVVSYYGPADLVDAYRHPPSPDPLHIRSVEETLIGGTPDEMPQAYADASPVTYLTRVLPPTLLIYGRRDHIVEARYGAQLRDRLAATGTRVAYLEIPWAEHAFDAVFNGPSSQLALYHTERFLAWAVR
jgi:acetyl esterase/lipase